MKYTIFSLTLFIVITQCCLGQTFIVPRAGSAISMVTWEQEQINTKTRTSFVLAIGMQFQIIEKLHFLVEAGFASKGHKIYANRPVNNNPDERIISDIEYVHNYVVLPVLVRKYFGSRATRLYANAGPYAALGMGGKLTGESGVYINGVQSSRQDFDGKISYGDKQNGEDLLYNKKTDFGVTMGIGLLVANKIGFDIRYEIGFSNLFEASNDYKNRSLQLSLLVPILLP